MFHSYDVFCKVQFFNYFAKLQIQKIEHDHSVLTIDPFILYSVFLYWKLYWWNSEWSM